MAALLEKEAAAIQVPKAGDTVKATVVFASNREVRLDVGGLTTGVRGRELFRRAPTIRISKSDKK